MSPVTRARPWEERLRGAAAVAGRAANSVVMQIHPEGGQSPCNIKARTKEASNEKEEVVVCWSVGVFLVVGSHLPQQPWQRKRERLRLIRERS